MGHPPVCLGMMSFIHPSLRVCPCSCCLGLSLLELYLTDANFNYAKTSFSGVNKVIAHALDCANYQIFSWIFQFWWLGGTTLSIP